MKLLTKSHDDLIREEAQMLRDMVMRARKAQRRARVLRLAGRPRQQTSGRVCVQLVGHGADQ